MDDGFSPLSDGTTLIWLKQCQYLHKASPQCPFGSCKHSHPFPPASGELSPDPLNLMNPVLELHCVEDNADIIIGNSLDRLKLKTTSLKRKLVPWF
jgi:hypothetical protein